MDRAEPEPLAELSQAGRASVAPSLGPLWALLYGSIDEEPGPEEMQVANVLSPGQRRATRRAVWNGRAAWDEPSARFAVLSARARRRAVPISPIVLAIGVSLMGLLFLAVAVEAVGNGDWTWTILGGTLAAVFLPIGRYTPFAYRKLRRGEDVNAALLEPDDLAALRALPSPAPAPVGERLIQFVFVFVAMTLVRLLAYGETLGWSAVGGAIIATIFVGVPWIWQAVRRR